MTRNTLKISESESFAKLSGKDFVEKFVAEPILSAFAK